MNTDIEKSIISIALQNPETILPRLQGDGVGSTHFSDPRNGVIYNLMAEQKSEGNPIELVSFAELLEKRGQLEKMGGRSYLAEVYTYSTVTDHYSYHLGLLRKSLARRKAIEALSLPEEEIQRMEPQELADHLKSASERVVSAAEDGNGSKTGRDACREFLAEFQHQLENKKEVGTLTGLSDIDEVTNGMRAGEFWVIAGPTSGGKSVLALQLALSTLKQSKRAGIFSLEMGAGENIARLLSNNSKINYGNIRKPSSLCQGDMIKIRNGLTSISEMNLIINDEAGLTIERINSVAQRWNDVSHIDVLIVDYVQLIKSNHRKGERTDETLCRISGDLKQLAKKLKCCVVTASQLNAEGRMAQASGIANDADVVLRIEGEKGVYVLKNRNGEKHRYLPLQLKGEYQRFEISRNYNERYNNE